MNIASSFYAISHFGIHVEKGGTRPKSPLGALCRSGYHRGCLLPFAGCIFVLMLLAVQSDAQVGPAEIADPRLKTAEQAYLTQMLEVNRAVAGTRFPFPFSLSRYAGLSPSEQIGADARGLEFVRFHDRIVLKLTGNYNAAYNADVLTANQRASRMFHDVIIPVLRLLQEHFTPNAQFDAFGFEIAYHVRSHGHGFDYEGKEIVALVMDKVDALNFPIQEENMKQQESLNRSEVYLDGKPFGLALGMPAPYAAEALRPPAARNYPETSPVRESEQPAPAETEAVPRVQQRPAAVQNRVSRLPESELPASDASSRGNRAAGAVSLLPNPDSLQQKYQVQLDSLASAGAAKHLFVDYAPPSFVIFRGQIALQLTLRNPASFNKDNTSIYKRAAQSFDLFLAPQLKEIFEKIPHDPDISDLDATVIDELQERSGRSSEALEFILPLKTLGRFVDSEITNQDLLDQSVVLVNGVRIALNLQLVE